MMGRVDEGSAEPLGVTPDEHGVNIAVFSAHASAIEFCLFDEAGERELRRVVLPERTGDVFHGHLSGVAPGARYGLRAHGPFAPAEGHRFNAAKLLVDPHAQLLDRPFRLHPATFGFPAGADDLCFDPTDSAPVVPKAVVLPRAGPVEGRPLHRWADTVVYELHVRGFTKRHPSVPPTIQGSFAALAHPAAVDHLVKLGITSVELMPPAAWIEERHLLPLGLSNYWGYNPVAFMAPEPRLAPGGWDEVRAAVARLAEAGIETLVDVVLNHSGEGDELGPTLSLRGLDNATYYRLREGDPRRYVDDSGCGNTLALDRAPVIRLVLDALRTWVRRAGVHGFRFDLASCMGRRANGFDPRAPLLAAIQADPELAGLKLVAEPWDIGPGGYQLGRFPASWGEWNDRFRDDARRFWRGDPGMLGALGSRLAGSADLFGARRPSRSVNFVTAHDGFALADLVAHEVKKNHANGEDNRDGCHANHSWNCGTEGETDDPAVLAARTADQRALLATLLLARGTPMLSMGAELGHSQAGNNNAYAQDNELSWLDWARADEALLALVRRLVTLRRALPPLRADRRLTGKPGPDGLSDVRWLRPTGGDMAPADWEAADAGTLGMLLAGDGERLAVLIHRGGAPARFALPAPTGGGAGHRWTLLLDTAGNGPERPLEGTATELSPRSVQLLAERPAPGGGEHGGRSGPGASGDLLDRLADAAGVLPEYRAVDGSVRHASPDTKRHLLAAMRLPAGSDAETRESLARLGERDRRALPAALVRAEGEPVALQLPLDAGIRRPVWVTVKDKDGSERRFLASPDRCQAEEAIAVDGRHHERWMLPLPSLPAGRYLVRRDDAPDAPCRLFVAPARAFLPGPIAVGAKLWGIAAQLYTLRRPGDGGIGDFSTLRALGAGAAAAGASAVGVNPLHALFPDARDRASPYQPSDRRFVEPMYLDLAALVTLPGGEAVMSHLRAQATTIDALAAASDVDYSGVWALKEPALRALFAGFNRWRAANPVDALARDFEAFVAHGGEALRGFATFNTIREHYPRTPWQRWPTALRDARGAAARAFAAAHEEALGFHLFLQWLCNRQLAVAQAAMRAGGMGVGLYRDLAVGAAPDGAEAWEGGALFAEGVSVGAPPDPLGPQGQVWGMPPFDPHALTAAGYAPFSELLEANMAHAGALRIDHAMGLARLFWVPDGAPGSEGAYVSYPLDDLLGLAALASQQHGCMVVGEDLGTVPEGFREKMAARHILGYRVLLLEREGSDFLSPRDYPALSLACVTNHDLPTFAGWCRGRDMEERSALGLSSAAPEERAVEREALHAAVGGDRASLPAQVHRHLGAGSSALAMVQADDLAGEEVAVNLPGTAAERRNWQRKIGATVDQLLADPLGLLSATAAGRRESEEAGRGTA